LISAAKFATAILLVFGMVCGTARAATLTWDGDTNYANGISNVSSNWNAVAVWRPASGSANVTWNSATPDDAVLAGTAGSTSTISNDAPTTVGSLIYNNTGSAQFNIVGSAVNSLTVNTLMAKTNSTGTGVLNLDTVKVTGPGAAIVSNNKLRFGNSTNDFTGGVTVNSNGWLQIGANSNPTTVGGTILNGPIGTGTLTVNGGQIEANGASYSILNAVRVNGDFSIANGYRVTLNGPTDLGGAIRTMTVGPGGSANLFFGGAVSNGAIVKTGINTLYLSGSATVSNSFTQGVIIQQGTLSLYAGGSAIINALDGKDLTLYEGTLLTGGSSLTFGTDNIILYHTGVGAPVVLSLNYGFTLNNVISETNGSVGLMLRLDSYTSAATTYTLGGSAANTYSGMTSLINSNVSASSAIFYLLLNKTSGLDAVPGDLTIGGKDTNNLSIVRYNAGMDNQIAGTSTVTVNPFGTFRVADNQATPVGRTETIKALVANNPSGSVQFGSNTIGRLSLGTDQGSGSGLFVNNGGTLSGTGQVTVAAASLAVNAGGTLSPGPANGVGALQILAAASAPTNVQLNAGSLYKWEVADWTGVAGTGYDFINVTGAVVFASTAGNPFTVTVAGVSLANFAKTAPASFTLLTASAGITGLTANNWTVTTTNFSSAATAKFDLQVVNGSGNAQSLVLNYTYNPLGTVFAIR